MVRSMSVRELVKRLTGFHLTLHIDGRTIPPDAVVTFGTPVAPQATPADPVSSPFFTLAPDGRDPIHGRGPADES